MGQNNSFRLNITDVIKEWVPLESDPSIFLNKKTKQHLQCFHIQIPLGELLREVTIYNARIQALYPYICRVAYFNQEENVEEMKGHHSFAVYTDHLFRIRDHEWTIQRFVHALEAALTLISYYGFFKLTEKMIWVNQRGQTKVWISHSPVNNHRDFVLTTEEQALAAFAGLVTLKNYEAANLLIGCCTLKDALKKMSKPKRLKTSPITNLSHRPVDRANFINKVGSMPYNSEFNQQKINVSSIEHPACLPKQELKIYSTYNRSDNALSSRSVSQHKTHGFEPKRKVFENSSYFANNIKQKNKKFNDTSFDNISKTPKQSAKLYPFQRFQTTADLKSPFKVSSPKNGQNMDHSFIPFNSAKPLKNLKPLYEDITIINNNVNHVVNNITHNHSHADSNSVWNRFRNARTPQFAAEDMKVQSHSPLLKKDKTGNPPSFIQQRKKEHDEQFFKHNIKSFYTQLNYPQSTPNSKSFLRGEKTHSSGINMNKSVQQSFKNIQMETSIQQKRKNQKLYTFCQPSGIEMGPKLFSTSFSPHNQTLYTPPNLHHKNYTQYFKKPNRTKTTDFNDTNQNKNFSMQSDKSFDLSTNKPKVIKEKTLCNEAIPEDMAENLTTTKSIAMSPTPSGKEIEGGDRNSFKKQLKLEFGNVLGPEPISQTVLKESSKEIPTQNNLKEKIQQKKMAFAQLKKEALAVLTDLF